MFENVINFLKNISKKEQKQQVKSKDAAKERLQLVLMQDRANISADFLDLMKQEIIEVIKKYIDVDENAIDVRLTNKANEDGTNGAPSLYANIPIISIKEEVKQGMSRQKDKNNLSEETTIKTEEISNNEDETENTVEEVKQNVEEVTENKDNEVKEVVVKEEETKEEINHEEEKINERDSTQNIETKNEETVKQKNESEQLPKFSNKNKKKNKHKNKHR